MGTKALARVAFGREGTAGTRVSAKKIWRGPFAGIEDNRSTQHVDEDIGIALRTDRVSTPMQLANISLPATPLTPEQAGHVFEAGIMSIGSGTVDAEDGATGYKYNYEFGASNINGIKSYTIETGDEDNVEVMSYGVCESFTISANKGEDVMISSNWFGRTAERLGATFSSGIETESVTHVHAGAGRLYINAASESFGSSQIESGNILEAELSVNTGRKPLFTVDSGSTVFQSDHFSKDDFSAELTLKWVHATTASAEQAKWRSDETRAVRLEFYGEAFATAGSANGTLDGDKKGIQINFPGNYTNFSSFEFEEGKTVTTATLTGGYEVDNGKKLSVVVVNEASAI